MDNFERMMFGRNHYTKNIPDNWTKEFSSIREIVAVVRRKTPEDDERIELEANLIVNGKRMERVEFGYSKSSREGIGYDAMSWSIGMISCLEDEQSNNFIFEVSDLTDDYY